jgi:hypothetical protein
MNIADIIYTLYISDVSKYEAGLKSLGVEFTTRDVLNGVWGTQFTIKTPKGKGSIKKFNAICELFEGPTIIKRAVLFKNKWFTFMM